MKNSCEGEWYHSNLLVLADTDAKITTVAHVKMYPQPEIISSKDVNRLGKHDWGRQEGPRSNSLCTVHHYRSTCIWVLISCRIMGCYITVSLGTLHLGVQSVVKAKSSLQALLMRLMCTYPHCLEDWWLSWFHAKCQIMDHLTLWEDGETQCHEPHTLGSLYNEMRWTGQCDCV